VTTAGDGRSASTAALPAMTPEGRDRFLARPLIARLATSEQDQPRVLPMWFLWEEPFVWMETGADFPNAAILARNPHAALVVDESDGALGLRAVVMRGKVDIIRDPATVVAMLDRIYVKYLGRDGLAAPEVQAMLAGEHVLLRFRPTFEKSWDAVGDLPKPGAS
jgi:nitroimidazol reductase NimA-like FMN-containing flavoprotein (pyridoxamine 5'-phosphate oxidase superfamily)